MTLGGWITLVLSVGFVISLFAWCITRILMGKQSVDRLHGLEDIDTKDQDDER
jgi:multisubunit Na+/H+ antiporter MnhF subunit